MRVTKEQAAQNREKILISAASLMRERGIASVGMDALAEAAGMTHGSLYSQFGSKEHLAEEAVRQALVENARNTSDVSDIGTYVSRYLSRKHCDAPGSGCALAALASEMPRSSQTIRQRFTVGVRAMIEHVSGLMHARSARQRDDAAIAAVATMVGGLVLSRAVNDDKLADRILSATRSSLKASATS